MTEELSEAELEAAHCWEPGDYAPGRPEMTVFRRRTRFEQALWRESKGHPIGSQPIGAPPKGKSRKLVGSRIPLDYAEETGANFVTPAALDAATKRLATKEPQQTLDKQGLCADLLSSLALCCNVFGDCAADLDLADRVVHTLWPDTPGTVSAVRFAHSPGRLDMDYLGSLVTFAVAFELDLGNGTKGVIGVATKYHEPIKREVPKPTRLADYMKVTEKSGVFAPEAINAVSGTDLTVMWLEHLLVHSMLQHRSGEWTWGRYVVVHPVGNTDYADACARYRTLLSDTSTFSSITLEDLIAAAPLPKRTLTALRNRYFRH